MYVYIYIYPIYSRPLYLSIYLPVYLPTYDCTALVGLGRFFGFLIYTQSVGLLGLEIIPSQGSYLHIEQHKHTIKEQTPMPRMGFELTIQVFERTKTVHAVDHAATVTGSVGVYACRKHIELSNIFQVKRKCETVPMLN
jgi:hypothetical protein